MIINFFRETSHFVRRILNTSFNFKLHFLLFLLSFLILARFEIDPDLGWHIAYGRHFLETGEILKSDIFSWTMPGYEWGNSYFLYQIIVAFLFEKLGLLTTGIIFGLISSLAILLILPRRLNFWAMLTVGLGIAMLPVNLAIRPHVFDFLFFAGLLLLLERKFLQKMIAIPLAFLLFAVWANLHLGFLVGLAVLVLVLAIDWLGGRADAVGNLKIRLLVIAAAVLGTFLTPFHWRMWQAIFFDSGGLSAWLNIAEFEPVATHFPSNALYALSGIFLIWFILKKSKQIEFRWFFLAAVIFTLPFLTIFFLLFWVAIFIFLVTRYGNYNFNLEIDKLSRLMLGAVLTCVGLALVLDFLIRLIESGNLERRLQKDNYPAAALQFIEQQGLGSNLYNDYGWGGYIDWQFPEIKVFIDGRMAGWRKEDGGYILDDYLSISRGNCAVAAKYPIKTVLVKKNANVSCFWDFAEVYQDEIARVLVVQLK